MAILRLHVQFFLCCVCFYCGLVLSPDESPDSLSASWDDTGRARSSNREVFTINTDARCHFRRLCPSCRLRSRPEINLFGFYSGDENSGFLKPLYSCLLPSNSLPDHLRGGVGGWGGGTQEFTGSEWTVCSRRSDSGVRYEGREGEKNKEEKRERALTPTPSPLCLLVFFFCLHLLYAVPTIWTPGTG